MFNDLAIFAREIKIPTENRLRSDDENEIKVGFKTHPCSWWFCIVVYVVVVVVLGLGWGDIRFDLPVKRSLF